MVDGHLWFDEYKFKERGYEVTLLNIKTSDYKAEAYQ